MMERATANTPNLLFRGIGRLSTVIFERGSGCYLYTKCGRKLLDFTSQIGVTNTGHCHPRIVDAAKSQIDKLIMGQLNIGYHEPMMELTELLQHRIEKYISMPNNTTTLNRFFYATTGAEAVENAVKVSKSYTKRPGIMVFRGGYHGRTALTMAMTSSSTIYSQGYMSSNPPNIYTLPFPYKEGEEEIKSCLSEVKLFFQTQVVPDEIACMVIEPVLGEGGYVPTPNLFLQGLSELCQQHNILLIMDEVQTGFGRTGKYFATEHFTGIQPDILILAKGLASGFPLSAVVTSDQISDHQQPGTMGGTYAGNVVSCAAAVATQYVLEDEDVIHNSQLRGESLKNALLDLQKQYPDWIRTVRGLGCMIGVEFHSNISSKELSQACFRNGMLLLTAGVSPTVRFIPPLIVTEQQITESLDIFEKSLKEVIAASKTT